MRAVPDASSCIRADEPWRRDYSATADDVEKSLIRTQVEIGVAAAWRAQRWQTGTRPMTDLLYNARLLDPARAFDGIGFVAIKDGVIGVAARALRGMTC